VREFPFYLAGKPGRSDRTLETTNPFDGSVVARIWLAGPAELDAEADAAAGAAAMRDLPAYERGAGPRYTIEEMTEPRLLVINRQLS